jgi:hypothetical protein
MDPACRRCRGSGERRQRGVAKKPRQGDSAQAQAAGAEKLPACLMELELV